MSKRSPDERSDIRDSVVPHIADPHAGYNLGRTGRIGDLSAVAQRAKAEATTGIVSEQQPHIAPFTVI
jgi:hypothetical protein